jgi:hypothetical protein
MWPFIKIEKHKLQTKSTNTKPAGISGLGYGHHQAQDKETKQTRQP